MNLTFSHRPCRLPGAPPEHDREVFCNGKMIGRVHMLEAGSQVGVWQWSCLWPDDDNRGNASSLEEGLQEIKRRTTPQTLSALPPGSPVAKR